MAETQVQWEWSSRARRGPAERPPGSDAEDDEHELDGGQERVQVDALVEPGLGDEPGVIAAVGEVEVDGHEGGAERGENRHREDGDTARLGQLLPAEEPDQRGRDE